MKALAVVMSPHRRQVPLRVVALCCLLLPDRFDQVTHLGRGVLDEAFFRSIQALELGVQRTQLIL
jgi:hypothetical protein